MTHYSLSRVENPGSRTGLRPVKAGASRAQALRTQGAGPVRCRPRAPGAQAPRSGSDASTFVLFIIFSHGVNTKARRPYALAPPFSVKKPAILGELYHRSLVSSLNSNISLFLKSTRYLTSRLPPAALAERPAPMISAPWVAAVLSHTGAHLNIQGSTFGTQSVVHLDSSHWTHFPKIIDPAKPVKSFTP